MSLKCVGGSIGWVEGGGEEVGWVGVASLAQELWTNPSPPPSPPPLPISLLINFTDFLRDYKGLVVVVAAGPTHSGFNPRCPCGGAQGGIPATGDSCGHRQVCPQGSADGCPPPPP